MNGNDVIIKVTNLTKCYKTGEDILTVLNNLNMEVKYSTITAIVGKSGSGKSTLLYLLGGLDIPTSGDIRIKSKDIIKMDEEEISYFRNKHIGFIFQFHNLLSEFTAIENVMIPGLIYGNNTDKIYKKAIILMDRLEIKDRMYHKPSGLSGGERQRVAIARALINDPDIILADEPTGDLDQNTAEITKKVLFQLVREFNKTMIIVTHSYDIIKDADTIYRLSMGRLNPLLDDVN